MTAPAPQNPYKLGPGSLTIGEAPDLATFSAMLTKASLEPKVDAEDPTPVLTGADLAGDRNYTYRLKGTFLQDLEADGLVQYTYAHKGEEQPFEFVPNTAKGVKITGRVVIDPVVVGGDVKKKNTTDLDLEVVGDPVFAPTVPAP